MVRIPILIDTADEARQRVAQQLSHDLNLPIVPADEADAPVALAVTDHRLELRQPGTKTGPVYAEFVEGPLGFRRRIGPEHAGMLARAVGWKRPGPGGLRIIDATVGLGRDAFMLAALGAQVLGLERSPVMHALVADGLHRAAAEPQLHEALSRLEVRRADAIDELPAIAAAFKPDVIYLDPMFPERRKSAAVKKEMVVARLVAGEDDDAQALLAAALSTGVHRITVKRPAHAPTVPGPQPTLSMKGTAVRDDVYVGVGG